MAEREKLEYSLLGKSVQPVRVQAALQLASSVQYILHFSVQSSSIEVQRSSSSTIQCFLHVSTVGAGHTCTLHYRTIDAIQICGELCYSSGCCRLAVAVQFGQL